VPEKVIGNAEVLSAFLNEVPFRNRTGTLVGVTNPATILRGSLDERETSRLRIDIDNSGIRYVVLSFGTPIAWRTRIGEWTYVVKQYLGPASEQHKTLLG
jgi:hypothetical protein